VLSVLSQISIVVVCMFAGSSSFLEMLEAQCWPAELPSKGERVVVRLSNPRFEQLGGTGGSGESTPAVSAQVPVLPRLFEHTLWSPGVTFAGLEQLALATPLHQRATLRVPAGSALVVDAADFRGEVPAQAALLVDVECRGFWAKTQRFGLGNDRPQPGHVAVVRLSDCCIEGGDPIQMPEVVRFSVGSNEVLPGLDAAVREMVLQERCELRLLPMGAFRARGFQMGMRQDATLKLNVELLGWL